MITLDQVKLWLKIDGNDEDELLKDLIEEAESELLLSGVPVIKSTNASYPLYKKAMRYIITRDYESRAMEEYEGKTLLSLILKLKASVPYEV